MARKKKNGSNEDDISAETQAAQHNAGMRKDIMRDCAQSMRRIIAQRKELNEEAGDIRKRLRDCDINVKAWEAALRLSDMDDDEARNSYLDGLREAFEAIGTGQMVSMFSDEEMGAAVRKGAPDYLSEPAGTA